MKKPWFFTPSVAASGTLHSTGSIDLVKARTVSITVRGTFNASAQSGATLNVYYSPDGNNFDTVPYATEAINLSAGSTVQETVIIDPPEHGWLIAEVVNDSSSYTLTNVKVWYTVQSYEWYNGPSRGSLKADTGEEDKAYSTIGKWQSG